MIDYTDAASANQRLSHAERDDAVATLTRFHSEGRLTDDELQQRSQTAQSAATRGDLAPLFTDLPVASAAGAPREAFQPSSAGSERQSPQSSGRPWRYAIMSLTPFVALALFFISGNVWGFNYAWLWFLLIPIAGILTYGTGGWGDHDRDRYRDR